MTCGSGYTMSGNPDLPAGVGMDTYTSSYGNRRGFKQSATTVEDTKIWRVVVDRGTTVNNLVFKPMLCTTEDYAISPEFVPYAPSNRELYEMILALQNAQNGD